MAPTATSAFAGCFCYDEKLMAGLDMSLKKTVSTPSPGSVSTIRPGNMGQFAFSGLQTSSLGQLFYPKTPLLIPSLLFCLGFYLLSYLNVSLILLSWVFDECLKRMLTLTTVFTLCSSMCRCFHSFCSHPTSAISLFIQSKWQPVTLGSAQREGHP